MNTLVGYTPILNTDRARENVILLEDLEFAMPKDQLEDITELHNSGMDFQDIAKEVRRNPYEVIIALLHQVKSGKQMAPLAYRKQRRDSNAK